MDLTDEWHNQWYWLMLRQATADGVFVSKDDPAFAKEHYVKEAAFDNRCGLSIKDIG